MRLALHQPQNRDVREPVGGNFTVFQQHGPAEVISLEQSKAFVARVVHLLLRLDFFRHQRNRNAPQPVQQPAPFQAVGSAKIHLDVIGDLHQGFDPRPPDEIVQRQAESRSLQSSARFDYRTRRLDILQDLQHRHA